MARRSAALLPACLVALCLCGLVQQLTGPAFVPPQRREVVAGLAAALAAAGAQQPAEAVTAKFSFFGFGEGASDPYLANDADAFSPYSQFSNPKDSIYVKGTDESIARKKTQLDNSFQRFEKIPGLLQAKKGEEVKSILTLQLYSMRSNMEYLSGEKDSDAYKQARTFFQDVSDIGVGNFQKQFDVALEAHGKAAAGLKAWKAMVRY